MLFCYLQKDPSTLQTDYSYLPFIYLLYYLCTYDKTKLRSEYKSGAYFSRYFFQQTWAFSDILEAAFATQLVLYLLLKLHRTLVLCNLSLLLSTST